MAMLTMAAMAATTIMMMMTTAMRRRSVTLGHGTASMQTAAMTMMRTMRRRAGDGTSAAVA